MDQCLCKRKVKLLINVKRSSFGVLSNKSLEIYFTILKAVYADITVRKVVKFTFERSRSFQQVLVGVREIRVNRGSWRKITTEKLEKKYRICYGVKEMRKVARDTRRVIRLYWIIWISKREYNRHVLFSARVLVSIKLLPILRTFYLKTK